jgi:hypothetical protein
MNLEIKEDVCVHDTLATDANPEVSASKIIDRSLLSRTDIKILIVA